MPYHFERMICGELSMSSVLNPIIHSPAAVAAIVALILAFVSGILGPLVQLRIGK
jgi:hypothetical protein